ncbi:UBE2QL1 (predicted) [Pycnogonum litorale]
MAAIIRKIFRSKRSEGKHGKCASEQPSTSSSPRKFLQRTTNQTKNKEEHHSSKNRRSKIGISTTLPKQVGNVRSKRLMKEYLDTCKASEKAGSSRVFTVELIDENLYNWSVKLYRIDPESELSRDMMETNTKCIVLNLTFPENFPFSPPFMRVVRPRIHKGFVMDGGAICMELLTPHGWSSAYTIEALIIQFAASVVKGHGRIIRKSNKDFNKRLAEASFYSLVSTHEKYGWVTPPMSDG